MHRDLATQQVISPSRKGAGRVDIMSGVLKITEGISAPFTGTLGAQALMPMLAGVPAEWAGHKQGLGSHVSALHLVEYAPTVYAALIDALFELELMGVHVHTIDVTWFTRLSDARWGAADQTLRSQVAHEVQWLGLRG